MIPLRQQRLTMIRILKLPFKSKKKKPYYKQQEAETPTVSSFHYRAPPILTAGGLRPDPSKVEAIVHYPLPTNLAELRTFLGMAQYLAKFCQHMCTAYQPLRQLEKKEVEWCCEQPQNEAFNPLTAA